VSALDFEGSWLDLRVAADVRARDRGGLADVLGEVLRERSDGSPSIVWDLGAGTGANVRYLAPRLPADTRCVLVEPDGRLRDRVTLPAEVTPGARVVAGDLRRPVETFRALPGPPDVVTSSALFDIGSAELAEGVLDAVTPRAWLFALEVDGRLGLAPPDPDDRGILDAFDRDQRRPKGLGAGPALGGTAPDVLAGALRRRGYRVRMADTAWRLDTRDPNERALVDAWLAGVARAVGQGAGAWLDRRRDQLRAGQLTVEVGHRDVLAALPRSLPWGGPR